jgi:hypothetical protein
MSARGTAGVGALICDKLLFPMAVATLKEEIRCPVLRGAVTCAVAMLACLIACVSFAFFDITVKRILWSHAIYWPLNLLFCCGIHGFITCTSSKFVLRGFGTMLGLASVGLVEYGISLCTRPAWWWGVVTLGAAFTSTGPLAWLAIHEAKRPASHHSAIGDELLD